MIEQHGLFERSAAHCVVLGGVGRGECTFEVHYIDADRGVWPPAQVLALHQQIVVDGRQGLMEVVQQLAQIGAGLGFVGVGPEKESRVLAVLGRGAVERKIGEQRLEARDDSVVTIWPPTSTRKSPNNCRRNSTELQGSNFMSAVTARVFWPCTIGKVDKHSSCAIPHCVLDSRSGKRLGRTA